MVEGSAIAFGYVPDEIIVRILHFCESNSILRFAATCKKHLEIVTNSISLQLHIELEANGLEIIEGIPNGNPDYSTILKELRRYRDAWLDLDLDYSIEKYVQEPEITRHLSEWILCEGAYIRAFSASEDQGFYDSFQIIPFGSAKLPPSVHFNYIFQDFTVDLSQEVAVLVGIHPGHAQIQFRSTTTGLPHPLAKQPLFIAELDFTPGHWSPSTNLRIMGNILLTKFALISARRYEVLVWDWVQGVLLNRTSTASGVCDVAFLDKEHLVLSSVVCAEGLGYLHSISLLIFDISATPLDHRPPFDGHFDISSCSVSSPILKLNFPRVESSFSVSPSRFRLKSTPTPSHAIYTGSVAFACSHSLSLAMLFTLVKFDSTRATYDPHTDVDFCVSVSGDHLLRHLRRQKFEGCTTTMTLPWDDWGENATRWFYGDGEIDEWAGRVSGSRHLYNFFEQHPGQDGAEVVSVLDFNTSTVRRHSGRSTNFFSSPSWSIDEANYVTAIQSGAGECWPWDFSSGDTKNRLYKLPPERISLAATVKSETETTIWLGFEQPVVSRLPYRVVANLHPRPIHDTWKIDGSHVIGTSSHRFSVCKLRDSPGNEF